MANVLIVHDDSVISRRWMLSDLIEDIQNGMFDRELKDTEAAYCREGGNNGEQV